uniref:Uncharacterized protein n=1 Tax=Strigamia maritima TaxID=126957 RepID=T1IN11_STRMM
MPEQVLPHHVVFIRFVFTLRAAVHLNPRFVGFNNRRRLVFTWFLLLFGQHSVGDLLRYNPLFPGRRFILQFQMSVKHLPMFHHLLDRVARIVAVRTPQHVLTRRTTRFRFLNRKRRTFPHGDPEFNAFLRVVSHVMIPQRTHLRHSEPAIAASQNALPGRLPIDG